MQRRCLPLMLLLAACSRPQPQPAREAWRDSSAHTIRMVRVAPDVQLETVDWGGSGRPVVLLAGLGNTAHVFDGIAAALTDSFHVYGITRRGFGHSTSIPAADVPTMVADLRAALDSLHLDTVSIVGHSIAGEEMTMFAGRNPARCRSLVYLDAAYDRSTIAHLFQAAPPPPPPAMTAADSATPAAYAGYVARSIGVTPPEAEVRQVSVFDSTGRYLRDVTPESLAYRSVGSLPRPNYRAFSCPALAIFAQHDSAAVMMGPAWATMDSTGRAAATKSFLAFQPIKNASRAQFVREARHGTVMDVKGANHYVFLSDRDTTLGAVRAFLLRNGR